jgi:hypothetical protein
MMTGWLDRRARKRYARSYKDVLAVRNDARGIAVHLRDALPSVLEYEGQPGRAGWASSIIPLDAFADSDVPLTPREEVMANAAKLGAVAFWFSDHDRNEPANNKRYTVIVFEETDYPPRASADSDAEIEVPAFAAGTPVLDEGAECDATDEDELKAERDCSE